MDDMTLQKASKGTLPNISPTNNNITISRQSASSFSSDPLPSLCDIQIPSGPWVPEIEQAQPQVDSGNSESGKDTEMSLQQSSSLLSSDASLRDRLQHVAEQAKLADFEDLDAVITAYHMAMAGDNSEHLTSPAQSSLRRVPRLIATMRHAAKEWNDWEQSGFPSD